MTPYPFSAVVGLADLRLALLLTAVSPAVGGVLVRGEKGTAKSTVVRALAALLPPVSVVRGCRFACDPARPDPLCPDGPHAADSPALSRPATLVELPVGATEDRVVGTLDIQRALADGVKAYEPGLLAAAHRGVLYVDEVNLLPDHLVDLLLDAAAMGRAHVERDGVSVKHAARFLLVGTMNPEEGEPRPQLVDRFGLVVNVAAPRDARDRAEVVRRRLAYELDPDGFAARFDADEQELAGRIVAARDLLPAVVLPDRELDRIALVSLAYGVDGMRADIVVARCAVALAAWHGRSRVTPDDVRDAARLALPHRRRKDPLDPPGTDEQRLEEALNEADAKLGDDPDDTPPGDGGPDGNGPDDGADGNGPDDSADGGPDSGGADGGPDGGGAGESGSNDGRAKGARADGSSADGSAGPDTGERPYTGPPPTASNSSSPDISEMSEEEGRQRGRAEAAPVAPGAAFRTKNLSIARRGEGGHAGRRSPSLSRRGRVVGSRIPTGRLAGAPHLPATLRAALHRAGVERAETGSNLQRGGSEQTGVGSGSIDRRADRDNVSPGFDRAGRNAASPGLELGGQGAMSPGLTVERAEDASAAGRAGLGLVREVGARAVVLPRDLREAVHVGRESNLVLFVVDASGSMAARKRMTVVKTAVLSLLRDAYQRRDRIGMITFRGHDAEQVLPPTSSHEVGVLRLASLRTGGRTPLAAGLRTAAATIATERRRDPRRRPLLIVVTDGRATSGPDPATVAPALAGVSTVVVDCESGPIRLRLAARLATVLGADLMPLESLGRVA
ncbi:VWA domain-containing protein [Actinoplanes sp. Pm04-4]|uniref:Mg-protoporphyrin IX chelatase n=1 Tax=Paractinoplanes pyxinae TaxID=2997416 RepID=A0ABT4AZA1_9ACTN|nr:VWA domain-containing protein [Actinoplanes pyxinae]MCY1139581.1 VWA domain-containing protein [Actinoplanes pyxinae]